MAHLTNPSTLEFREAFVKGHPLSSIDIPLILQCKNIDFGHVSWPHYATRDYYDNKQLMYHVIDNIVDINIRDENLEYRLSLLSKICTTDTYVNDDIYNYVMNNGCVNNLTFILFKKCEGNHIAKYDSTIRFGNLVSYLTRVSFDRFRGYYNIEKYYYMIHTMLLVMKAQQMVSVKGQVWYSLPNTIIKHLIIPFIYQ